MHKLFDLPLPATAIIACVIFAPLSGVNAEDSQNVNDLAGLWAARRDFTPDVGGTLRVSRNNDQLQANFSGYVVDISRHGNDLYFALLG